jgi:hypothetical protein
VHSVCLLHSSAYHVIRIDEILRVGQCSCPSFDARFRQMAATRLPERTGTNMAEQANLKQYDGSQRGSQPVRQELGVNPLTPESNFSAQSCLPRLLLGILIFKWLIARRLYNSFGVKGLTNVLPRFWFFSDVTQSILVNIHRAFGNSADIMFLC